MVTVAEERGKLGSPINGEVENEDVVLNLHTYLKNPSSWNKSSNLQDIELTWKFNLGEAAQTQKTKRHFFSLMCDSQLLSFILAHLTGRRL